MSPVPQMQLTLPQGRTELQNLIEIFNSGFPDTKISAEKGNISDVEDAKIQQNIARFASREPEAIAILQDIRTAEKALDRADTAMATKQITSIVTKLKRLQAEDRN